MNPPRPALVTSRMTRRRRRLASSVALGVWLSGVAWLLSHDVFVPEGEFGPSYRGADAWLLTVHGAFGFACVWLLGLLWGTHVGAGWAQHRRRGSGGLLLGLAGLLVLSGYGLYYCGDEALRSRLAILHWGAGLVALGAFLAHRLSGVFRGRAFGWGVRARS